MHPSAGQQSGFRPKYRPSTDARPAGLVEGAGSEGGTYKLGMLVPCQPPFLSLIRAVLLSYCQWALLKAGAYLHKPKHKIPTTEPCGNVCWTHCQRRRLQVQVDRVHHDEDLLVFVNQPGVLLDGRLAEVLHPAVFAEEGGGHAERQAQLERKTVDSGRQGGRRAT